MCFGFWKPSLSFDLKYLVILSNLVFVNSMLNLKLKPKDIAVSLQCSCNKVVLDYIIYRSVIVLLTYFAILTSQRFKHSPVLVNRNVA
jgi:hypothetical protein